jgi:hypothetical protein
MEMNYAVKGINNYRIMFKDVGQSKYICDKTQSTTTVTYDMVLCQEKVQVKREQIQCIFRSV